MPTFADPPKLPSERDAMLAICSATAPPPAAVNACVPFIEAKTARNPAVALSKSARRCFSASDFASVAAAIPHLGSLWLVLAVGMIAVLAHMAWLINLSALVVDLVPKGSLGFTFGVVATGSSLGGMMMNKAVGGLVTHLSYDPAFHFMLLLHPLAWLLLWQLRPRSFA